MSMLDKLFKKQPQISANRFLNIKESRRMNYEKDFDRIII